MGISKKSQLFAPTAGVVAAICVLFLTLWAGLSLPGVIGLALGAGVLTYFIIRRFISARAAQAVPGASVSEVFPTTGMPRYTYQKRVRQEQQVNQYRDHGTGLLSVFGPTKAGKSVLVKKLMAQGLYVRGDVETAETLWSKAITELAAFTNRSVGTKESTTVTVGVSSGLKKGPATLTAKADYAGMMGSETGKSVTDDPFQVVQNNLVKTNRALIVDDFHFMPRTEQKKVMAALKGLIDAGGRAVVVTATHRAHLVGSLVPNMSGRFKYVEVERWSQDDLKRIARAGFTELNLTDPHDLAAELATNSFGSPQLMQRLCQQLCTENGYYSRQQTASVLNKPSDSWPAFYARGLSRMDPEVRWLQKLKRGPQERKQRLKYETVDHGWLDGYELIRFALKRLLPMMDVSKEQIVGEVLSLVVQAPKMPRSSETAAKLRHLDLIAREPLDKTTGPEEDYRRTLGDTEDDELDVDPVLEFEDSGPTSMLRIVDPLYAFALSWWDED
jgi:hypothetical protein